ncbi:MAG: HU family DNA-binding protein [Bacteroidaceae bacterium]|nr:HU family DNA-binding protein [Bacteroidaceae bacterium]
MSEKITLQSVAEAFSKACGLPKKTAEHLARAFFETITEKLNTDESVKINGLGTFKIVEVSSRESINVTNGERILIPGYKKVTFTPEDGVLLDNVVNSVENKEEKVNKKEAMEEKATIKPEEIESAKPEINNTEENVAVISAVVNEADEKVEEEVNSVLTPEHVEIKEDEFSGIDMLICTPESVAEIKLELENARSVAAKKLAEAKEARREVLRLETLLEKMENGVKPEAVEDNVACTNSSNVAASVDTVSSGVVASMVEEATVVDQLACAESSEDVSADSGSEDNSIMADDNKIQEETIHVAAETVASNNDAVSVELPNTSENKVEASEISDAISEETTESKENVESMIESSNDGVNENEIPDAVESKEPVEQEQSEGDVIDFESNNVEANHSDSVESETQEKDDQVDASNEQTQNPDVVQEVVTASIAEGQPKENSESKEEVLNRFLSDSSKPEPVKEDKDYWLLWVLLPLAIVLIVGCSFIAFKYHSDKQKKELKELPVKPKNNVTQQKTTTYSQSSNVKNADTLINNSKAKAEEKTEVQEQKPATTTSISKNTTSKTSQEKQKTYVLKRGETLTRVSRKFYNTADSVNAIIKINKIKNPDNVQPGTELKLP